MATSVPAWMPPLTALFARVAPGATARWAAKLLTTPGGQNPPQDWELEPLPVEPRPLPLRSGIYAEQWGDDGPIVFALHGWRGRVSQFRRLAPAIAARGARVVVAEAPGHGRTPGRHATPRLMADMLEQIAGEVGRPAAVIGHSMGGVAAGLAADRGLTDRLVLIGAPARISVIADHFAGQLRLTAPALVALERLMDEHGGRPFRELDLLAIAGRTTAQAMIVHDHDDPTIAIDSGVDLHRAWPGSRALFTRGLGHRDVLADPSVIDAITGYVAARLR